MCKSKEDINCNDDDINCDDDDINCNDGDINFSDDDIVKAFKFFVQSRSNLYTADVGKIICFSQAYRHNECCVRTYVKLYTV